MPPLPWRVTPKNPDLPSLLRDSPVQLLHVPALQHESQHLESAPGAGIEGAMSDGATNRTTAFA